MKSTRNNLIEEDFKQISNLIKYLPKFNKTGRKFIIKWFGGKDENGNMYMPYPKYYKDVVEFFYEAGSEYWTDVNYLSNRTAQSIRSDAKIKNASLQELKKMITYCTRGERSCDRHSAEMLKRGIVIKILERLKFLHNENRK